MLRDPIEVASQEVCAKLAALYQDTLRDEPPWADRGATPGEKSSPAAERGRSK